MALAVLGARYDPGPVSHGWWAAGGILSVALLAHLTLIRVRQHRIAVACTDRLPLQGSVDPATRTSSPLRLWFIGVALLTGIALTQVYQDRVSAKQDHLRHARQLAAVVQSLDDSSSTVDLSVPGVAEPVTLDVVSTGNYRVGQEVPVVADLTGTSPGCGWRRAGESNRVAQLRHPRPAAGRRRGDQGGADLVGPPAPN